MADINFLAPPKKSMQELLEIYKLDRYLIMDDVLSSNRTFKVVFQDLLDILKSGFEIKEVRTRPIKFKFHTTDKRYQTLELRHFLSNLILWRPFIDIDKAELLNSSYIYDFTKFNINTLIDYINTKILPVHDGDFASKNEAVDDIAYSITAIAHAFCPLFGVSISIHNLNQFEKRCPEVGQLIRSTLPDNLQPHELEELLQEQTDRLIKLIIDDPEDNDLKPLFLAGKNISNMQFREFILHLGMKADMNGNTIPILINDNFLMTGLTTPAAIYVNAASGRHSLMLTKLSMGVPGAFSKKLNQCTTSCGRLREDSDICDSIATVDYFIRDDLFLKLLNGRYYYDQYGEMKLLDYHNDKHLIGKIVRFRSPATCSSDNGQTVCKYCYGHLYEINKEMFSAGCLASTKISEPSGQSILSAKHVSTSNSDHITFNSEFDDVFEINSSDVNIKSDLEADSSFSVVLNNVQVEESDDSEFYYVTEFDVVDETNKFLFHVKEDHEAKLYLNDEILNLWKKAKDKSAPISLDDFDDEASLFTVEIKSQGVTNLIETLQKALNTNDHLGATTVSEFCQIFAENLIRYGIKYDLVHAEMVIRSLLRKKSNIFEFPDWTAAGNHNDYQILSLNSALYKNPSPLVSMCYGHLRRQLISAELYTKSAPSHLDPLFVRTLADVIDQ